MRRTFAYVSTAVSLFAAIVVNDTAFAQHPWSAVAKRAQEIKESRPRDASDMLDRQMSNIADASPHDKEPFLALAASINNEIIQRPDAPADEISLYGLRAKDAYERLLDAYAQIVPESGPPGALHSKASAAAFSYHNVLLRMRDLPNYGASMPGIPARFLSSRLVSAWLDVIYRCPSWKQATTVADKQRSACAEECSSAFDGFLDSIDTWKASAGLTGSVRGTLNPNFPLARARRVMGGEFDR
jgi:hypothetical protein